MAFQWLKSIMPKGLYGRAALILTLPIVTIQVAVTVVFIQRHFEGVTKQLSRNMVTELRYVIDRINETPDQRAAQALIDTLAPALDLDIRQVEPGVPGRDDLTMFQDLTGSTVIRSLRSRLPEIVHIDLSQSISMAHIEIATNKGTYGISFSRQRVSASNPHQMLVMMVLVSVFITLISFVFLRNQVRPIRRLARVAEAFGKGRHLPYRIAGATEVRAAGQAFLDMRERIVRQIEQRTLMLSGVSHDLRTPLTRLKLGLSLIEGDEAGDMVRDVDDMAMMLDEFLTFARGDSLEETEYCDPSEIARQVASDAGRAGRVITLDVPDAGNRPRVPMRPVAVRRALENLVANAQRHGSRCNMALRRRGEEVIFAIEDDGPGIPPEVREIAQRPFERLDQARNQNRGTGVGLGLAIATDIASSHGGRLVLGESAALGGLKVEMHLPA
ncbi:MAG: ATP-binding protein [Paracoccaceae bacterium]